MSNNLSILEPSLRDLADTISDFRNSPFQSAELLIGRFVRHLNEEPLAGFLSAVLPEPNFAEWLSQSGATVGSMVGSGTLDWPINRAERVAMQIAVCRAIADETLRFIDFVHDYYYSGRSLSGHVDAFATKFLDPLLRDLTRLMESRPVPPVLFEAMGQLPTSGDSALDGLLKDACTRFRDPAPKSRAEATEKLWDAWERLKSIEIQGNKRLSVSRLLDLASPDSMFRDYLESEANALTEIGNKFHIRHFETDKTPLVEPEQHDYLFHRLYALMHFLLFSRQRASGDI